MIPEIIHQTWKTSDLPENLLHWHNVVKELHPGWEINLWTDKDNLALVKEHFPQMLDSYQSLEYNIMRVDIIRYMYMEVFGGYYLDLDYELLIPFDNEISDTELLIPISRKQNGKPVFGNCIFGSVPHHPFWKDVLNDFYRNPPLKKIYNKHNIIKLTGPEFITRIYFQNSKKYNGTLPARNVFHPPGNISELKNYKEILKAKGSRGIHHCEGSWRATKNPIVYLISKINSKLLSFSKNA